MIDWTEDKIDRLRALRTEGRSWVECAAELGLGATTVRLKGVALGLPRQMPLDPSRGVRVVQQATPEPHEPKGEVSSEYYRIPHLLAPLQVGEAVNIEALSSAEIKKIHTRVSKYGLQHDRGFRGRYNWRQQVIRVERVR